MVDERTFEYVVLRYAPNPLTEEFRNMSIVFFDPLDLQTGFCKIRFVRDWKWKVLSIDPDADVVMLESLLKEIERRLGEPNSRQDVLDLIEDSFSNVVRVSDRQTIRSNSPELALEDLLSRLS